MAGSNKETGLNFVSNPRRIPAMALLMPLMLSVLAPVSLIAPVDAQESDSGMAPEDIWSEEYSNQIFPWGGNDRLQFREYHDYFTMKDRMQQLADQNGDIMSFHEGLVGGVNARGQEMGTDDYEGWYYLSLIHI